MDCTDCGFHWFDEWGGRSRLWRGEIRMKINQWKKKAKSWRIELLVTIPGFFCSCLFLSTHTHTPADHLTIPRSIQSTHPKRDSRLSLLSHGSNWDGSSLANSLSLYFLNRILTEAKRGNGPFCEKRVLISQVDEDVIHFFSPSWRGHIRCHRFCALSSSLQLGTKSYVSLCHVRHQFRRFSAGAGGRDMRW
jgi:hypothetical protein